MKILAYLSLLIILTAASGIAFFVHISKNLPNPEILDNRQSIQSTKIYDRSGEILLYEIYGEEKRTIISFDEIPEYVKQATIAIEDANFYEHPAFSWRSIIRALFENLIQGRIVQGGSTISQQLAKNAFLSSERTLIRKIKELILALKLEKRYTKDEILNLYLNQIPYGANAYGIEAASQTYFKKSAKDLNLAEAALLTSLPKAPTYYSPWGSHVDELMARKDYILNRMQKLDFIDEDEKPRAQKTKLQFSSPMTNIKAPHFVIMIQEYLNKQYGEDFVRTAGLKVITTLNWDFQQLAEKVVADGASRNENLYQGKNAALIAQDAKTGQILALVGSRDYFDIQNEGNFNVATQGLRQPGSAIKPFIYTTALLNGYTPETIVFDLETEFDTTNEPEKSYKPQNFDEKFRGPVTLREGLAQSINVPSVKTLYLAGLDNVLNLSRNFGITTLNERSRYGLSLALGGGEIKLFDLVGAYSVFSQEGVKHKQTFILEIKDSADKIIEQYHDQAETIINPQYPRLINEILSDSEARAPLFANSLNLTMFPNQEVALKTGTTNDYRDAWAIGYTPSLAVGVWAGNNNNQPMQKKAGSILAAVPIWNAFMSEILKDKPPETFNRPEPIFIEKPILRGEYIINGEVHEILYYINKDDPRGPEPKNPETDPQFKNWEEPVIKWIQENPDLQKIIQQHQSRQENKSPIIIEFVNPKNGDFIKDLIMIDANIQSDLNLDKIEIYLNGNLINSQIGILRKNFHYQFQFQPINLLLQNSLKIIAFDAKNKSEKEIIVFK